MYFTLISKEKSIIIAAYINFVTFMIEVIY